MATKNNPVLGYLQCADCSGRSTVHKAGGNRSGFYYRRCNCGCDQRNGAAVQTALYNGCDWFVAGLEEAGLSNPPPPPPNYIESTESTEEASSGAVEGDENQPDLTGELIEEVETDQPVKRPIGLIVGGLLILVGFTAKLLRGGAS